jgi:hypothetical protein
MPGSTTTVDQVQFMTAKQLSTLMGGEQIGRPDDTPVCLVKLKGSFISRSGHLPNSQTQATNPQIVQQGAMVFDAITGNLLILAE